MGGSLALKLRLLRAERAWTIEEAARQAGVTPETISDAEHGKRRTYLPTLRKLAAGYGIPTEELLRAEAGMEERGEPVPLADAPPETGQPEQDPLSGWVSRALSEGNFASQFERAKGSRELADELGRAKDAEVTERNRRVVTLEGRDAPKGEILEAERDLAVAKSQLTAARLLAVELWRGRDVSEMEPRTIVADVLRTQHGEIPGLGEETMQGGKSA